MSRVRTVRDVVMMVGGAALFVYSLATASSSPLAYMLGMAMLCLPIVMHGDRRRERADVPAPVTRPDADVAQYLHDEDREWLGKHDWRPPGVEPGRTEQVTVDGEIVVIPAVGPMPTVRCPRETCSWSMPAPSDRHEALINEHIGANPRCATGDGRIRDDNGHRRAQRWQRADDERAKDRRARAMVQSEHSIPAAHADGRPDWIPELPVTQVAGFGDDAPDPGPVPDGDYETIVDGLGRPVRYIQT